MHSGVAPRRRPGTIAGWQVVSGPNAQKTMLQMVVNIRDSLRDPAVIETARGIIRQVTPRDCVAQAAAIRAWVDRHFLYVPDPLGVELLETPATHLAHIKKDGKVQGDCDDAATLAAALGEAVGLRATLHALAYVSKSAPYQHVVAFLHPPHAPAMDMDITHPKGAPHAPVSRELVIKV